jgi:predicted transposase YdaD
MRRICLEAHHAAGTRYEQVVEVHHAFHHADARIASRARASRFIPRQISRLVALDVHHVVRDRQPVEPIRHDDRADRRERNVVRVVVLVDRAADLHDAAALGEAIAVEVGEHRNLAERQLA